MLTFEFEVQTETNQGVLEQTNLLPLPVVFVQPLFSSKTRILFVLPTNRLMDHFIIKLLERELKFVWNTHEKTQRNDFN